MRNASTEEKRIAADILIAALQANFLFNPTGDNEDAAEQLSTVYRNVLEAVVLGTDKTS
jgi:hypothetical protein